MSTLPTLVRVILVLTVWFTLAEKVKLVLGVTMIAGPEIPPRRVRVWEFGIASSVMVTVVCEGPTPMALKVNCRVHVPPCAGMVWPRQVSLVFEKPRPEEHTSELQ